MFFRCGCYDSSVRGNAGKSRICAALLLLLGPSAMPQSQPACSKKGADAALTLGFAYGMDVMKFMLAYNAHNEHDEREACNSLKAADRDLAVVQQYHMVDDAAIAALTELAHVRELCLDLDVKDSK